MIFETFLDYQVMHAAKMGWKVWKPPIAIDCNIYILIVYEDQTGVL